MKKLLSILMVAVMIISFTACTKEEVPKVTDPPETTATEAPVATEPPATTELAPVDDIEVGDDSVTSDSEDASEWDPTFTVVLNIVGLEEDILFNGTVTLKSSTMWASEFLKAAMTDKGYEYTGIDDGYVTVLGDYIANPDEGQYWLYTVNGNSPAVACNEFQLRDGDVMVWTYGPYEEESVAENVVTEGTFEVGTDSVEAEAIGAGEWDPTYEVNMLIVNSIDDIVLYNGTVSLKSPTMWASEFLKVAVDGVGLTQIGVDTGALAAIGDYEQNADEGLYWMYYVNGIEPSWYSNAFQLRDGDYVTFSFEAPSW